ncbi:hypothetical protein FACS1894125_5000 [Actinomycetota bacterium]|nr:hypothetical protein FACS1894125_5000 [Actinomycetota bacterium]
MTDIPVLNANTTTVHADIAQPQLQNEFTKSSGVNLGPEIAISSKNSANEPMCPEVHSEENLAGQVTDASMAKTAIIKLNGGLGTTMGLDKAKSLLEVKDGLTFLDIIVRQVLQLRSLAQSTNLPLIFMNSFNTSADTTSFLRENYPDLQTGNIPLEFVQHQEPKIDAETFEPVDFPANPKLEWCPPGHGDFYSAIYASGVLEQLLKSGVKYAFVSNADNLGATFDAKIAEHFANSGASIMLELAQKTEEDIKGGHIVLHNEQMRLREVAQIAKDDKKTALDLNRHPYFNTNSLWLNLDHLYEKLSKTNGVLELPLIVNHKTVDPKDPETKKCIQLESAIGAAIGAFEKTEVICVPRTRFRPVKTTADLDLLRSNTFRLDGNYNIVENVQNA